MPKRQIIESGTRYGKLTYLYYDKEKTEKSGYTFAFYRCDCGNIKSICQSNVKKGQTTSCGCYWRKSHVTHGVTKTPIHNCWQNMKQRCTNKKVNQYKNYGGRGIKVCDRWLYSFENFFEDMGNMPSPNYTLDRIDVNGNYEPSNCKWSTTTEQGSNKRNNRLVEYNGEIMTMSECARRTNVNLQTFMSRVYHNNPLDKSIKVLK